MVSKHNLAFCFNECVSMCTTAHPKYGIRQLNTKLMKSYLTGVQPLLQFNGPTICTTENTGADHDNWIERYTYGYSRFEHNTHFQL